MYGFLRVKGRDHRDSLPVVPLRSVLGFRDDSVVFRCFVSLGVLVCLVRVASPLVRSLRLLWFARAPAGGVLASGLVCLFVC